MPNSFFFNNLFRDIGQAGQTYLNTRINAAQMIRDMQEREFQRKIQEANLQLAQDAAKRQQEEAMRRQAESKAGFLGDLGKVMGNREQMLAIGPQGYQSIYGQQAKELGVQLPQYQVPPSPPMSFLESILSAGEVAKTFGGRAAQSAHSNLLGSGQVEGYSQPAPGEYGPAGMPGQVTQQFIPSMTPAEVAEDRRLQELNIRRVEEARRIIADVLRTNPSAANTNALLPVINQTFSRLGLGVMSGQEVDALIPQVTQGYPEAQGNARIQLERDKYEWQKKIDEREQNRKDAEHQLKVKLAGTNKGKGAGGRGLTPLQAENLVDKYTAAASAIDGEIREVRAQQAAVNALPDTIIDNNGKTVANPEKRRGLAYLQAKDKQLATLSKQRDYYMARANSVTATVSDIPGGPSFNIFSPAAPGAGSPVPTPSKAPGLSKPSQLIIQRITRENKGKSERDIVKAIVKAEPRVAKWNINAVLNVIRNTR